MTNCSTIKLATALLSICLSSFLIWQEPVHASELSKIRQMYLAGQYRACRTKLKELFAKGYNKNAEAYYYYGLVTEKLGSKYSARHSFEKVIKLSPNSSLAHKAKIQLSYLPKRKLKENRSPGPRDPNLGYIGVYISRKNVIRVYENSPAQKAGIRVSDEIIGVDNKSTKGLSNIQVQKLLTGKIGSKVNIIIRRGTRSFATTITRSRAEIRGRHLSFAKPKSKPTNINKQKVYISRAQHQANKERLLRERAKKDITGLLKDLELSSFYNFNRPVTLKATNQPVTAIYALYAKHYIGLTGNIHFTSYSSTKHLPNKRPFKKGNICCPGNLKISGNVSIDGVVYQNHRKDKQRFYKKVGIAKVPLNQNNPLPALDIRSRKIELLTTAKHRGQEYVEGGDYIAYSLPPIIRIKRDEKKPVRIFLKDKPSSPAVIGKIRSYNSFTGRIPKNLQIWYNGSKTIILSHNCNFRGVLYAPNATILMPSNNQSVHGSIYCDAIYGTGNIRFNYDENLLHEVFLP